MRYIPVTAHAFIYHMTSMITYPFGGRQLNKLFKKLLRRCQNALRKRLHIRPVISVNYHYITILFPFNLFIRFICYNTV